MESNESKKIIASDQKAEFKSIEATVNLKRDPLEIRILGSLYLNWALSDSRLIKVERANEAEDLLIWNLPRLQKPFQIKASSISFSMLKKLIRQLNTKR